MSSEGHEKSKMFEKSSVEHENRKREGGAGGRVQRLPPQGVRSVKACRGVLFGRGDTYQKNI